MPGLSPFSLEDLLNTKRLELTLANFDAARLSHVYLKDWRIQRLGLCLTGDVPIAHPDRLYIVGMEESSYVATRKIRGDHLEYVWGEDRPVAIVAYDRALSEYGLEDFPATFSKIPVFITSHSSDKFIEYAEDFLKRRLALFVSIHAQLVEVFGVGLLIMGESGIGKSETTLDLVMRGHTLIADDIVEVRLIPPDDLMGKSNDTVLGLMEVRGIGLVDIRRTFGIKALKREKKIDVVVRLITWDDERSFEYERIGSDVNFYEILGIKLPYYVLPVRHGSNLSSLMEAVALDFLMKSQGINPAREFEENLLKMLSGEKD